MKAVKEFIALLVTIGIIFLILHSILPASWLAQLGITQ